MKNNEAIPYIAVSNEELAGKKDIGNVAICPRCTKEHPVFYGTKDGAESRTLGFVTCTDGESYLVAIMGKLL